MARPYQEVLRDDFFCHSCGNIGKPKTITRGSIFIEIILWLCFLVPGIIYSVWRLTSRYKACHYCNSANIIPRTSPNANQIERDQVYSSDTNKKCPFCAEIIKAEAIVCRFCGKDIDHSNPICSTHEELDKGNFLEEADESKEIISLGQGRVTKVGRYIKFS